MSMYQKTLCTIYAAKNGYVVECTEPPEPAKKGQPSEPSETEHVVAPTVAAVLKIVKQQLTPDEAQKDEYSEGFDEAVGKAAK